MCPGSDNIIIPFSLANCNALRFLVCVQWPSKRSKTFFYFEGLTVSMKCCNHLTKISLFMYPLSELYAKIVPGGAPSSSPAAVRERLYIINGGMYWPAALTQQTAVVVEPLSPLAIEPTAHLPFPAITFLGFLCTVDKPVSSTLKTRVESSWFSSTVFSNTSKKLCTFSLLKPFARAKDVDSGCRKLSSGCLFINA